MEQRAEMVFPDLGEWFAEMAKQFAGQQAVGTVIADGDNLSYLIRVNPPATAEEMRPRVAESAGASRG